MTSYVDQHKFTFDEVFDVNTCDKTVRIIYLYIYSFYLIHSCIDLPKNSQTVGRIHVSRRKINLFCLVNNIKNSIDLIHD